MKKNKIMFLIIMILFLTGCECEYNLTINGNNYNEEVILTGDNSEEINSFDTKWEVPINKYYYNIGSDSDDTSMLSSEKYDYTLKGNTLTFKYNFNNSSINTSTAIYNCFNSVTINNYEENTIISTSTGAICLDKYPDLKRVVINITVDKEVISENADTSNGNTYTWYINKDNANNKSIDMLLDNTEKNTTTTKSSFIDKFTTSSDDKIFFDTEMYIFAFILFIVLLIGYSIIKNMQNNSNLIDNVDNNDDLNNITNDKDDE